MTTKWKMSKFPFDPNDLTNEIQHHYAQIQEENASLGSGDIEKMEKTWRKYGSRRYGKESVNLAVIHGNTSNEDYWLDNTSTQAELNTYMGGANNGMIRHYTNTKNSRTAICQAFTCWATVYCEFRKPIQLGK